MVYGYIRVSTREQNEDRQRIALRKAGIPEKNIFIDKQSGKDFDRPNTKSCSGASSGTTCSTSRASTAWAGTTKKCWNSGDC